ncbi:MAG: TIGR03009 domain-containing protein, partial [Gemmataceae bacterium]|nr:TIGR03009 domain-containing protein [Gemmataceae bacterium]
MRPVGMTLAGAVLAATVAAAQPQPDPAAEAARQAEAAKRLDAHLLGWQTQMGGLNNFRANFEVKKTEAVFKKEQVYGGAVLCMKPTFARLRLQSETDRNDYEAYICNGKSIFAYNGLGKSITEVPLPPNPAPGAPGGNLMLDFLGGMTAQAAKQRFRIGLWKEDAHYVYLNIEPVLGADKQEFTQVRFALYGPGLADKNLRYLPAQLRLDKPNGDFEVWTFSKQEVNLPGVGADNFKFENVPGYSYQKAQPGGPAPGGAAPP